MSRPLQILIAEDNAADAKLVIRLLRQAGFEFEHQIVDSEQDYLRHLHPGLDIILSDYEMPQFGGMRALELLKEHALDIPFIIISGTIGEELAVAVMKRGAADYLLKDRLARLGPSVQQALEQGRLRRERKKAELALRESEERFRQVTENILEVFWLIDVRKNQILYVSPAYERIWGRSCADLYSSPRAWLEAMHPEDRRRVVRSIRTKKTQKIYDEEYRIIRPDGTVRWIRDRAFPVANGVGEVERVAGVARDITEGKQAGQALRLFRKLVDQSDDTFEVIDPQTGRFLDVNAKGPSELGCTREEYLSMRVFDVAPSLCPSAWRELVEETRAKGAWSGEGRHRRMDGSTFPIEFTAKWVHLDKDYIVQVVRNITKRKRAEESVRELAGMLDRAQDGIIVRNFDDRKVTFWSKGAEHLYGWTVSEAIGRDIADLICVDAKAPDEIRSTLMTTNEWRGEVCHSTKDGRRLIVNARVTLVRDAEGRPKSVLSINTDITEQKNLESRFLRAQRMESIGTLASGVAHDLNNILAPILMFMPMLRGDLKPEQREEIISSVEVGARRGADIVKQVLTFGRGLEGDRCPLQASALILEITKIIRETFPKNIVVETSLAPDLWLVIGDVTQLHQVLLNLCLNGRDAMPNGGRLLLRASNVELDQSYASMLAGATPGPNVLLEVHDTGGGIPADTLDRIFDPFFTTKGIGKGTGLGLSTALGIVKSHRGHIKVTSEVGQGTSFQIYLPATRDPESSLAVGQTLPEPPLGDRECVLVADDEEIIRRATQMSLESHGYKVLLAVDGPGALAVFARESANIAVVLTDLMMPYMDGVSLIHALQKIRPDIPIIASTGLGKKADLAQLKLMKVKAVLNKPYGTETLLNTIHAALQKPALSPVA